MKRLIVPALVLAGSLLACHHPTAAAAAAAGGQPVTHCGLLTQQAVEAIYGGHLNPGREMGMGCTYLEDEDGTKGVLVAASTFPAVISAVDLSQMYDQMIHSNPDDTVVPISGLGDKASYMASKNNVEAGVEVMYHTSIIGVTAYSSKNPNVKDALILAARQVMQKL